MRLLAMALVVMSVALLPSTAVLAAEPGEARTADQAVGMSLDLDVLTSQAVGQSTQLAHEQQLAYLKLDAAKAALRVLARRHRRDRRAVNASVARPLRQCHLEKLDGSYEKARTALQAEITRLRGELGYVNRQKWITRLNGRLRQLARRGGGILEEALHTTARPRLADLLELAIMRGGGFGVVKSAGKQFLAAFRKRVPTVFRQRLQRELLAKVTGAGQAPPLEQAAADCRDFEGDPTPVSGGDPSESYDEGLDSGPFNVRGIYGFSPAFGRQAGATMSWEGIVGEECAGFEAYNPEPMDPRNEKLQGVEVILRLSPDEGRFVGSIKGKTESSDFSKGGHVEGHFRVILRGTITTTDPSSGWFLEDGSATARLTYTGTRACPADNAVKTIAVGPQTMVATTDGAGPDSLSVDGRIQAWNDDRVLELEITGQQGDQSLQVSLQDIALGPTWVSYERTAQPTASPTPAIPGSDEDAPWDQG
jgi:hypothetical protein